MFIPIAAGLRQTRRCGDSGAQPSSQGPVERNHGAEQGRPVKELRLAGISATAGTNRFLEKTHLPKMNQKFSFPAAKPEDAHVPLGSVNMKGIMCLQHERTVANNYVVHFETHLFQILKTNNRLPLPRDKVAI
ncbi:MAG: hypothetical protein LBH43_04555 [Treponema sp.]|jgi:hypothetical protein|nr:hypothetical protein [Treponema sp.]